MSSAAHALAPCTSSAAPLQAHGSAGLGEARGFAVPTVDMLAFASLPEKRRVEITYTLRILSLLHAQIGVQGKCAACATLAAQHRHAMRGLSAQSLYRKYQDYMTGGWRALVKGYKAPSSQPETFVQEVRRRAELNHRSVGEAMQQLREEWAAGASIPGYGTWVEHYAQRFPSLPIPKVWPRGFYPTGWSVDNLRRLGPAKGARMLALRGVAASKKYFPSIKRDPSNFRPLELITIDDFELDCLCLFSGDATHKPQIGRMAGLLAIDVATRKKLVWGLGQRLERIEQQPDGTTRTVRTGIARVDMQQLLFALFSKFGLPDYPITLLVENASAAISPEMELSLSTLFEGRVVIQRTGLINAKTLTNGFVERGGKPWEKGWIESTFNQLWNTLGAMKGYKGSNQRLNAPASLDEALRYTKILIGQGERTHNLPPEAIAQLRAPFMSPAEAEAAFAWAISVNEQRDNHDYIGFHRVTEFQLAEGEAPVGWDKLALLSPEEQLAVRPVERMQTVAERWATSLREVVLTPLPAPVLALLLLTPKRVAYRGHRITFVHDREGYTYVDASGKILAGLPDGVEFLAYFDAARPERLQLADLSGRYLGELPRLGGSRGAVDMRDQDALDEAAALQATVFNRAAAEVAERHAPARAQAEANRAHNAAIVAAHKKASAGQGLAERIAQAGDAAKADEVKTRTTAAAYRRAGAAAGSLADLLGAEAPAAYPADLAADDNPGDALL